MVTTTRLQFLRGIQICYQFVEPVARLAGTSPTVPSSSPTMVFSISSTKTIVSWMEIVHTRRRNRSELTLWPSTSWIKLDQRKSKLGAVGVTVPFRADGGLFPREGRPESWSLRL
ncbi:hypothetical protein JCGZ_24231 [Jatropha curcas]|uniref:Uncharacterized protein n=1 Tax=Jatropha curcas TaxID=180498 RepID=A0A067LFN4_JATCU|nr:hypothetical protein JCGZ_24231 [Jatropha curcas]